MASGQMPAPASPPRASPLSLSSTRRYLAFFMSEEGSTQRGYGRQTEDDWDEEQEHGSTPSAVSGRMVISRVFRTSWRARPSPNKSAVSRQGAVSTPAGPSGRREPGAVSI